MRAIAVAVAAFVFGFIGAGTAFADVQAHWNANDPSYPRGYAYIEDETGAWAPVYTAAIDWDSETRLDLTYTTGTCTSSHCFPMSERNIGLAGCDGSAGTIGVTNFSMYPATGHILSNTMTSEVDSACSTRGLSARTELVCHEMGHTLSLTERSYAAHTCMRTGVDLGTETDGDTYDFADLHAAYNHSY